MHDNKNYKIPKKIHYCWLSGEPFPHIIKQCMDTWRRVLPDYELIMWDQNRFDITSVKFVEEACNVRKWAFAADYIRLHALYTEGGIYLDTDVYVLKPFDMFLDHSFFTSIEIDHEAIELYNTMELLYQDGTPRNREMFIRGIQIQAAIMGAVKGHPFIHDCMNYYHHHRFILPDGSFQTKYIAPHIYARKASFYGFVYKDKKQMLKEDMAIYPSETFAGHLHTSNHEAYAIHMCAGSWRGNYIKGIVFRFWVLVRSIKMLRWISGKKPILTNKVSYRISQSGLVTCQIFSLSGQLLWERKLGYQDHGTYICHWQDFDMPDGKYMCNLMAGDKNIKEFLLIKDSSKNLFVKPNES